MSEEIEIEATADAEPGGSLEEVQIKRFEKLTDDQIIRLFIFEKFISREYDGHTTVEDMDKVCNWVLDGKLPRKTRLQVVKSEDTT